VKDSDLNPYLEERSKGYLRARRNALNLTS
jgi:hypothetical protein